MKIHIVQKGDTIWEIAQHYGVNFEELKEVNSHISSPDMIMPGMKIKIPGTSKHVKKDSVKKPVEKHNKEKDKMMMPSYPSVKEDDVEKPYDLKPKTPKHNVLKKPMTQAKMPTYENTKNETMYHEKTPAQPQPLMGPPAHMGSHFMSPPIMSNCKCYHCPCCGGSNYHVQDQMSPYLENQYNMNNHVNMTAPKHHGNHESYPDMNHQHPMNHVYRFNN